MHPTLDPASGRWTTTLALEPGSWRVLADFVPAGGEQVVLGADLVAEGTGTSEPLGEDVLGASVDGYEVILETTPVAGEETAVVATVRKDGVPVTDLDPYLGELGHLVVLRDGDLAYVHGHPDASAAHRPGDPVRGDLPERWALPALPGVLARGCGAHRGVHRQRRGGRRAHAQPR